jgi:hypothetical protein
VGGGYILAYRKNNNQFLYMEEEILNSIDVFAGVSVEDFFKVVKKLRETNIKLGRDKTKYQEKWFKNVDLCSALHTQNLKLREENITLSRSCVNRIMTANEMIELNEEYKDLECKITSIKEKNKELLDKFSYKKNINNLKEEINKWKLTAQNLEIENNALKLDIDHQLKKIKTYENNTFIFNVPKN